MKALIDEVVLFKAACASVTKKWCIVSEEGTLDCESYRDAVNQQKLIGGDLYSQEIDKGSTVATMILDKIIRNITVATEADEVLLFLSKKGATTFRHKLATMSPYKGQRPPKPKYYDVVYEHIVANYPCQMSTKGREVDDELGIMQTSEDDTIICTIDKDLLQIPGFHFHLDKRTIRTVSRHGTLELENKKLTGTGLKFFYAQMLLGDTADNIPGIPATCIPGEAKLVSQRIYDGLQGDLEGCEKFVALCYKKHYTTKWKDSFLEVGRLVRILTVNDKALWMPEYIGRKV